MNNNQIIKVISIFLNNDVKLQEERIMILATIDNDGSKTESGHESQPDATQGG